MAGVPAKRIGWMSKAGIRLDSSRVSVDGSKYKLISKDNLVEE